jgi:hypothetical protein
VVRGLKFAKLGQVGADRLRHPGLLTGEGGTLRLQGAHKERQPSHSWDQGTTKNQGHLEWSGKGLEPGVICSPVDTSATLLSL